MTHSAEVAGVTDQFVPLPQSRDEDIESSIRADIKNLRSKVSKVFDVFGAGHLHSRVAKPLCHLLLLLLLLLSGGCRCILANLCYSQNPTCYSSYSVGAVAAF